MTNDSQLTKAGTSLLPINTSKETIIEALPWYRKTLGEIRQWKLEATWAAVTLSSGAGLIVAGATTGSMFITFFGGAAAVGTLLPGTQLYSKIRTAKFRKEVLLRENAHIIKLIEQKDENALLFILNEDESTHIIETLLSGKPYIWDSTMVYPSDPDTLYVYKHSVSLAEDGSYVFNLADLNSKGEEYENQTRQPVTKKEPKPKLSLPMPLASLYNELQSKLEALEGRTLSIEQDYVYKRIRKNLTEALEIYFEFVNLNQGKKTSAAAERLNSIIITLDQQTQTLLDEENYKIIQRMDVHADYVSSTSEGKPAKR